MMSRILCLLALTAGNVAAFAPKPMRAATLRTAPNTARYEADTYWEGEAPPSAVLGNLKSAPAALLGPLSAIFLLVGLYCVNESQLASPLTSGTVNPAFVVGSLGVPVSWGLHVAAWIQKKNGV